MRLATTKAEPVLVKISQGINVAIAIHKQEKVIRHLRAHGDWIGSKALAESMKEDKYRVRAWLAGMLVECTVTGWVLLSRRCEDSLHNKSEYKAARDPLSIYCTLLRSPIPLTFTGPVDGATGSI